eukprot:6481486-Amphidinium_carterae.2
MPKVAGIVTMRPQNTGSCWRQRFLAAARERQLEQLGAQLQGVAATSSIATGGLFLVAAVGAVAL